MRRNAQSSIIVCWYPHDISAGKDGNDGTFSGNATASVVVAVESAASTDSCFVLEMRDAAGTELAILNEERRAPDTGVDGESVDAGNGSRLGDNTSE